MVNEKKSYKDKIMNETIKAINALLNTGGGMVQLLFKGTLSRKQLDGCVRIIEQKVEDLIETVAMVSVIKFEANPNEIVVKVKQAEGPFFVNYNLYVPTKSQVKAIPSSQPIGMVRKLLNNKQCKLVKKLLTPGSFYADFVQNQRVNFDEDVDIQWKNLKYEESAARRPLTLADRITGKSNKLPHYVSAYANFSGGHIYYGINDGGVVEGEKVKEKDQIEITEKVAKTVEEMIWPRHCSVPQKGEQWDIMFIPVKDDEEREIESTYVIVIAIARCPGGVFTRAPEIYHIKDGKVERKNDWMEYFPVDFGATADPVPSTMPLLTWSAAKNRKIYRNLTTKLVQFRNDKKIRDFNKLCEIAMRKFPGSCAQLVIAAERAAIACKNNKFLEARGYLNDFSRALQDPNVKDVTFFDVRGLCLRSRNERAEGNHEKSYQTAKQGLQIMQSIPPEFLTVWFYIHAAAVASILASKDTDPQRCHDFANESQAYLEAALRDASALDQDQFPRSTADLKQKAHIYLVMAHLGCSLSGEILEQRILTKSDIDLAASELKAVQSSIPNGFQPTHFQEIEILLAQSDLFYKRSTLSRCPAEEREALTWAFENGKKAQSMALDLDFEEAVHYANRRLSRLTELLLRNAFASRSSRTSMSDLEALIDF